MEIQKVPREANVAGWITSTKLLDALSDELNCNEDYNFSWEEIDDVIVALGKRGYIVFEEP